MVRHSEIISFFYKKSQISSNQHQVKLSNTKVTNSLDGEEKTKSILGSWKLDTSCKQMESLKNKE